MGPYLHVSYEETNSHQYLDNVLAEQTVPLTGLEQRPCGKDKMDQKDCCSRVTGQLGIDQVR